MRRRRGMVKSKTRWFAATILLILLAGCAAPPSTGETKPPAGEIKNSEMLAGKGKYAVTTENVKYFENFTGFLAQPAQAGSYPGVVMIHEWWGLNDNIKDMAKQLASEGYVVLAVDLFGEVANTSDRACQLVGSLNSEKAVQNMRVAAAYLRTKHSATKIASLGWCFGGGQSLRLALSGEKLDATVIYYGSLVTNESNLSAIKWPVLGIFGDKDTSIPVATVSQFDAALDKLGIENEIYVYKGVGHAFANPSGANYAANETKDAWDKTVAFLNKHTKK